MVAQAAASQMDSSGGGFNILQQQNEHGPDGASRLESGKRMNVGRRRGQLLLAHDSSHASRGRRE